MNKYRNKKIKVDMYVFDSIAESKRYRELVLLERAGQIKGLKLQPKFELQPSYKSNNKTIRAIHYIGDFEYYEGDKHIVEDVKGVETEAFKIKKKMFEYMYNDIELRIVK